MIDSVQLRKIYNELIPLADKKGLNVLCGTQMRYHTAIKEAIDRVRDGQIGDITSVVCLRYEPTYLTGWYEVPSNLVPEDVRYQLLRWLAFTWTSGDQFVEQYIHNLDLALWAVDKLPVEVIGSGGRQTDIPYPQLGDRQSNTHAHFEFGNGVSLTAACRQENGTSPYSPLKVYGTKGVLDMTFGIQTITGEKPWKSEMPKKDALVCEHEALFGAIRSGKHINTMKTCADSCFVAIAGREAAYAGKRIKTAWFKEKSQLSLLPENLVARRQKADSANSKPNAIQARLGLSKRFIKRRRISFPRRFLFSEPNADLFTTFYHFPRYCALLRALLYSLTTCSIPCFTFIFRFVSRFLSMPCLAIRPFI